MVTVAISVGGVDYTSDVVFEGSRFTSFVNGKPGEARMRVRDSGASYSFVTGADWLVEVDGNAAWRGFVQQVIETFIAPTGTEGPTRFFDLVGADYNILFLRRVVENQATPTIVAGTQFPPATADTTAITELLANWLDLSSDDIDTTSGVTNVGDLDPAQKTRAWSGGWYWNNAMDTIAMLPAAIYYLRPETGSPKATLCYVDVDAPTSPFGLSDRPNGTTTKGYREMEITLDGSSMANDVLAWGFGYGSNKPVFKREQASASIAAHGLWQAPIMAFGVYKQATINRMADSLINGSPSSKRGAKNNRPSVSLVTYEPGLLAGHVVDFESLVWGFSDAIPVRQMTLVFEAPEVPRYELILSHEIDAPWSFIDQFWPAMPGLPPCWIWPCEPPPCPTCGQPQETCGETDDFNRSVSGSFGTSSMGLVWNNGPVSANAAISVNGSEGDLNTIGPGFLGTSQVGAYLGGGGGVGEQRTYIDSTRTMVFRTLHRTFTPSDVDWELRWGCVDLIGAVANIRMATGNCRLRWTFGPTDGTLIPDSFFTDSATYTWTVFSDGAGNMVSAISDGSTSYTASIALMPTTASLSVLALLDQQLPFTGSNKHWFIDSIDLPEFRDCTPQAPVASPDGFGCEDLSRSSSTVYTTSGTFVPGTTFIWRDGLFQRRGVDYTEDSGNQSITFSDSVGSSDVIRGCYFMGVIAA